MDTSNKDKFLPWHLFLQILVHWFIEMWHFRLYRYIYFFFWEGGRGSGVGDHIRRQKKSKLLFSYSFVLQMGKIKVWWGQYWNNFILVIFYERYLSWNCSKLSFLVFVLQRPKMKVIKIKKEDNKIILFSYIFVLQRCKIKVWWGHRNME